MRLLVLSPQDSSEACLGVLVTGSTHQQALRCTLSDTHRHRLQETAAPPTAGPQRSLSTLIWTPRHMHKHGQVPETRGVTSTEHLLYARPWPGRRG